MKYAEFLAAKAILDRPHGIKFSGALNSNLFEFQRDIVQWALARGSSAIFAGTGLGKTLMQLSWADAIYRQEDARTLIMTPLAVAEQTAQEAAKFGILGAYYSADGTAKGPITITNYDRVDKFNMSDFGAVVLDESSIIKSHDGKTRQYLTDVCRDIQFKLCCTATPSPNDYTEIGQHAEFLGAMSAKEMLATFFVHDGGVLAQGAKDKGKPVEAWRLKSHAERDFWRWVASWAILVRRPSDMGYDDSQYVLPPLVKKQITVPVEYTNTQGTLFKFQANTLSERLQARRGSIADRAKAAAALVASKPDEQWVIWCHLNTEEEALCELIPGAVPVRGTDDRDLKAARLLGFTRGEFKVLVSKPSIAGFGMNWQQCANMIFVGLNDSFEQLYQAIRRCWRFGQKRQVNIYMIASELEGAVVRNLDEKEAKFERMADALAREVRAFQEPNRKRTFAKASAKGSLPAWL